MAEDTAIVRHWLLLRMLAARRLGVAVLELAQELAVSVKTVRRDLELLSRIGFPIQCSVGTFGKKQWRIDEAKAPPLTLLLDEAMALHLGHRLLSPLVGTYFWDALESAMAKIRAGLSAEALAYLDRANELIHWKPVGASNYLNRGEAIDLLLRCVEDMTIALITYHSLQATEPVTHELYPLGLAQHRHSLYLIAFAPEHRQIRHYKTDRILGVEPTTLAFNLPGEFDLERHLSTTFGIYKEQGPLVDIVVRFQPPVARYVAEHRWHESQRLSPQDDGSLLAFFRLDSTMELSRWILSFGGNAAVEQPESLRELIQAEAKLILRHYATIRE